MHIFYIFQESLISSSQFMVGTKNATDKFRSAVLPENIQAFGIGQSLLLRRGPIFRVGFSGMLMEIRSRSHQPHFSKEANFYSYQNSEIFLTIIKSRKLLTILNNFYMCTIINLINQSLLLNA